MVLGGFFGRVKFVAFTVAVFISCAVLPSEAADTPKVTLSLTDKEISDLFAKAGAARDAKNPAESIDLLQKIVSAYEEAYKAHPTLTVRTARTKEEALLYVTTAAAEDMAGGSIEDVVNQAVADSDNDNGSVQTVGTSSDITINLSETAAGSEMIGAKGNTIVIGPAWSDAYYLQAYDLVELGHLDPARNILHKALALSPQNAQYQNELGYIYQAEKDWDKAVATYRAAAASAQYYSPQSEKNSELARAWRGEGFVLIEMGRLDEATDVFKKCLKLDKNDAKAKHELAYIKQLSKRAK